MSKRLIIVLLLVSLAFNLAVLGMFLYRAVYFKAPLCSQEYRHASQMAEHRFGSRDRDNDRPEFAMENREEIRKLRADFMEKRKNFANVLMTNPLDEKKANEAMEASLQAQDILEKKLGAALIEMRKKMTDEEAKEYFSHRMERLNRRAKYYHRQIENQPIKENNQGDRP